MNRFHPLSWTSNSSGAYHKNLKALRLYGHILLASLEWITIAFLSAFISCQKLSIDLMNQNGLTTTVSFSLNISALLIWYAISSRNWIAFFWIIPSLFWLTFISGTPLMASAGFILYCFALHYSFIQIAMKPFFTQWIMLIIGLISIELYSAFSTNLGFKFDNFISHITAILIVFIGAPILTALIYPLLLRIRPFRSRMIAPDPMRHA